jgi:hypothetical protein
VEKGVLAQRNLTRNGKRREATAANLAKQTSAEELLGPPINFTTLSPKNKGQRKEHAGEGHREK